MMKNVDRSPITIVEIIIFDFCMMQFDIKLDGLWICFGKIYMASKNCVLSFVVVCSTEI